MAGKRKSKSQQSLRKNAAKAPFDPMAVRWAEKYSDTIDKVWSKLPDFLAKFLVTVCVCFLGISVNGEWAGLTLHAARQFGFISRDPTSGSNESTTFKWSEITLKSLYLENLGVIWMYSISVSFAMYYLIGGFLHWHFYVRQRDKAEEWKCQPNTWLSPELTRHEIVFGSITLLIVSSASAIVNCYCLNGGYNTVYYQFTDYPWWWLILQGPLVFMFQDYSTYLLHRLYHTPWLYRHFHKLHHKYKQPTAFSTTAIHPVEALHIQSIYALPLFVVPVHWAIYYAILMYIYYHGIIDHSGINFKSFWWQPWQPDAIFHDNHHQYFHVNFGFNMSMWDKVHGTYRLKDRIYTEEIFYGRGKALSDATATEIQAEVKERLSENPLAYRGNKREFELSKAELKKKLKTKSVRKSKTKNA